MTQVLTPTTSRRPAVLRWLPASLLNTLERWVLRSHLLQRFVLHVHRRAWRHLLRRLGRHHNPAEIARVGIVGGGLFPRTAILLAKELPDAHLTIIDGCADSLQQGMACLREAGLAGTGTERVSQVREWFDPARHQGFDLLVLPLAFRGDKERLRRHLPAPFVVFHDWIWQRSSLSVIVSVLLLKRMSLHRR